MPNRFPTFDKRFTHTLSEDVLRYLAGELELPEDVQGESGALELVVHPIAERMVNRFNEALARGEIQDFELARQRFVWCSLHELADALDEQPEDLGRDPNLFMPMFYAMFVYGWWCRRQVDSGQLRIPGDVVESGEADSCDAAPDTA